MPASVSSLIPSANTCPELVAERILSAPSGLLDAFTTLPDPRKRRGRRHEVASVVAVAVAAILTGARSYAAIWAWAVDAPLTLRTVLGISSRVPCESTFRRVLQQLDPEVLDGVVCAWLAARTDTTDRPVGRRVIAVDGKSARGARQPGGSRVHLLAALDQHSGVVLAQTRVDSKTNEINAFRPLLDRLDLRGAVVTADALHTQRAHVNYLRRHGAHYVFVVKANQPRLHTQLSGLPWSAIPTADHDADKSHGRVQTRTLKLAEVPAGIGFPGAKLAIQIHRTRRLASGPKSSTERVFAVTDLGYDDITPADLAAIIRGHWSIENRLHWVRDVTLAEDQSQVRTGHGPQVLASLRNLAVSLHRQAGATNIAAACRRTVHRPERLFSLLR